MRNSLLPILICVAVLAGCESEADKQRLAEAQRNFQRTVQATQDDLQWKLDDATAVKLFDDGTQAGLNRYLTFRRCHEEPPTKEANKKVCADLQKRVATAEAKAAAKEEKDRKNW